MRALLKNVIKKSKEICQKIAQIACGAKTRHIGHSLLLAAASGISVWGGYSAARIAAGLAPGVAPSFLPATLPLLVSGTLYIDRFAAVFCVMLSAVLLLAFLRGTKGVLVEGITAAVLILGVITAATPLTLVAWLVLTGITIERSAPQKTRLRFLFAIGGIVLGTLLLSGGAFLADMTVVATVSSQLPKELILLALTLLFAGSLWSIREFKGPYMLVPAYVILRFCLFFLGSVSASFLTLAAFVAIIAACCVAHKAQAHAYTRTLFYALFMAIPLTMLAVQMQIIVAVQCFLFGGLALAFAGLLGDVRVFWAEEWSRAGGWLKILQSALPGTLLGTGSLLVLGGFWSLGETTTGIFESAYLLVLAALFVKAILLLARLTVKKEIQTAPGTQFSGPAQALLLVALGVGFAQILALVGTTIGGKTPDWIIELPFKTQTLTITPWMCFVGSMVVIGILTLLQKKNPQIWHRLAAPVVAVYAWIDEYKKFSYVMSGAVLWGETQYRRGLLWLEGTDARMEKVPLKETALVLLACFVMTLIVLF
jgi:hypothetical protein